jgi:ankyrin repeat protein
VALLLEWGACITMQNEEGSSALMLAASHGHMEIVQMISAEALRRDLVTTIKAVTIIPSMRLPASVKTQYDAIHLARDNDGSTALRLAEDCGHADLANFLRTFADRKAAIQRESRRRGLARILPQLQQARMRAAEAVYAPSGPGYDSAAASWQSQLSMGQRGG